MLMVERCSVWFYSEYKDTAVLSWSQELCEYEESNKIANNIKWHISPSVASLYTSCPSMLAVCGM